MMKSTILIFLLCMPVPISAQPVQHWWFSPTDISTVDLHTIENGIVCISFREQRGWGPTQPIYSHYSLDACLPVKNGDLKTYELFRETVSFDGIIGEVLTSSTAVTDIPGGGILIAAAVAKYEWECLPGMPLNTAGPMRLFLIEHDSIRTLAEFPAAMHPNILRSSNGEIWLAWEDVTLMDRPPGQADGRYLAEVHTARIAQDFALQDHKVHGAGYSPQLVERSDGAIFLLRRNGDHSASISNNRLLLRRIGIAQSSDIVVAEGLRIKKLWNAECIPVTGKANTLHIVWNSGDSLKYYHCRSDLSVMRSGPVAVEPDKNHVFDVDSAGVPILFWKQANGQEISWTPVEDETAFGRIHAIPGTEHLHNWTVQHWPDGDLKLRNVLYPSHDSLMIIRNATSASAWSTPLFLLPPPPSIIRNWLFTTDGSLWLIHKDYSIRDSTRTGLYRVSTVALEQRPVPRAAAMCTLYPNHPNPFNPATTIRFNIQHAMRVSLSVMTLSGREVRRLIDGEFRRAGMHEVRFEADNLPSGVYIIRFSAGREVRTRRMLLLR